MQIKLPPHLPGERVIFRALFCFAVLATSLTPVVASEVSTTAPTQEQQSEFAASTESERLQILIMLIKSGNPDMAEYFFLKHPLQGKHAANRTLYIKGLIKKSRGDLTGAAKEFRSALAADPKLTLVRADLAETLYQLEEDESAIHHLKLLQSEAPDAEAATGISSFIDRIDSRSPYKFNAYVSAAPTSNVNSGSIRNVIYLPGGFKLQIAEPSKRKSGLGVAAGANASYAKRFGNDQMFVVSGGVDGRMYDHSDFDSLTFSQSAELRNLTSSGYVSLGFVASQSINTDSPSIDYMSYGPRVSWRHGITHQDLLNLSATYEIRDYAHSSTRDGGALLLNGALTHIFDSSFSATLETGFTKVTVDDDNTASANAYETFSAGLELYKELPFGLTVNAGANIETTQFEGHFYNVAAFDPRTDLRAAGNFTLTKRDLNIFGFAPSITYSYTWNDSNYGIYDFDTHAVDLRLTKEF